MLIATWNVNGIRAREEQFLAWIAAAKPAVICLQETKAQPEQLSQTLCRLAGYDCYWHPAPKGYSGVGLHLRTDAFTSAPIFAHPAHDFESRLVTADVEYANRKLTFASLYMPNGGKDYPAKVAFMKAMIAWVREVRESDRDLVLCGDMNVARASIDVHPKLRDPTVIGQSQEERGLFSDLLVAGNLVDMQRALEPDNTELFTWWPYWREHRARNMGWRLDYILSASALASRISDCRVLVEIGTSDHAPVVATLGLG